MFILFLFFFSPCYLAFFLPPLSLSLSLSLFLCYSPSLNIVSVSPSSHLFLFPPSLSFLGLQIQGGEHSSVDDARAAMALYRMFRAQWEKDLRDRFLANRDKRKAGTTEEGKEEGEEGEETEQQAKKKFKRRPRFWQKKNKKV